jgi:hypothetical protein
MFRGCFPKGSHVTRIGRSVGNISFGGRLGITLFFDCFLPLCTKSIKPENLTTLSYSPYLTWATDSFMHKVDLTHKNAFSPNAAGLY